MSDILQHHGVLGMKWGIRRYQPYSEGKRVAGGKEIGQAAKASKSDGGGSKKNNGNIDPNNDVTVKTLKAVKQGAESTERIANKIERYKREDAPRKDLSKISDSELRAMINRLDMERRYNDLTAPDLTKGEKFCTRTLSIAGDVLAVGVSAAMIYAMLKTKGV